MSGGDAVAEKATLIRVRANLRKRGGAEEETKGRRRKWNFGSRANSQQGQSTEDAAAIKAPMDSRSLRKFKLWR